MIYLDKSDSPSGVTLADGDVLVNERPALHLSASRIDSPVTDLEADAVLRGLLRWKLMQPGGGAAVTAALSAATAWQRRTKAAPR